VDARVLVLLLLSACGDDAPAALDCLALPACGDEGLCQAAQGACVAASDADCLQASSGCTQYGWCSMNMQGECVKKVGP